MLLTLWILWKISWKHAKVLFYCVFYFKSCMCTDIQVRLERPLCCDCSLTLDTCACVSLHVRLSNGASRGHLGCSFICHLPHSFFPSLMSYTFYCICPSIQYFHHIPSVSSFYAPFCSLANTSLFLHNYHYSHCFSLLLLIHYRFYFSLFLSPLIFSDFFSNSSLRCQMQHSSTNFRTIPWNMSMFDCG